MNVFSTTLMVDKKSNCEKKDAELLLLGAKAVNLDEFPKLKYIYRAGIGCDKVPIGDIRDRRLKFIMPSATTREIISRSVACLAFGWIMQDRILGRSLKKWYREPCTSIWEKKILVYGVGHVGKMVCGLCNSAALNYTAYDAKSGAEEPDLGEFDIITFHVPLICYEEGSVYRDNRHLIDIGMLARLKKNVVLINTSRGGIANEQAISSFLTENPKAKYITDVFEKEPFTTDNALAIYVDSQVYGTPHIGSYTHQVRNALTKEVQELIEKLQ